MIPNNPNRILINCQNPSGFQFDIDELHDQLSISFKDCGVHNKWMVDDILIALQNYIAHNGLVIKSDEELDQVHAMVVKVLQDNGLPEIAEHFSRVMQDSSISFLNRRILDELKKMELSFSQRDCSEILNKILGLGFKPAEISNLLIREISRIVAESEVSETEKYEPASPGDILPFEKQYVSWNWDYLQMRSAGSLFNSIRIDIFPLKLASDLEMPMFIEMVFMSKWEKVLSNAASYLETCLYHLRDFSKKQIDYISIVIHETDQLVEKFDLGEKTTLPTDLNHSVSAAFGNVINNFSGLKLSSTQK